VAVGDRFRLERFVEAQAGVYERACVELGSGRKRTHWMWFIFPQIAGLGSSPMAVEYAISGMEEARAYLAHEVLGARLKRITGIVLGVEGRGVGEIFGYPDDLKFHSSMTLFALAAGESGREPGRPVAEEEERVFGETLRRYFGGEMDQGTLEKVKGKIKQGLSGD
jgi:uncharacterized protein (DUF1810 family)